MSTKEMNEACRKREAIEAKVFGDNPQCAIMVRINAGMKDQLNYVAESLGVAQNTLVRSILFGFFSTEEEWRLPGLRAAAPLGPAVKGGE